MPASATTVLNPRAGLLSRVFVSNSSQALLPLKGVAEPLCESLPAMCLGIVPPGGHWPAAVMQLKGPGDASPGPGDRRSSSPRNSLPQKILECCGRWLTGPSFIGGAGMHDKTHASQCDWLLFMMRACQAQASAPYRFLAIGTGALERPADMPCMNALDTAQASRSPRPHTRVPGLQ